MLFVLEWSTIVEWFIILWHCLQKILNVFFINETIWWKLFQISICFSMNFLTHNEFFIFCDNLSKMFLSTNVWNYHVWKWVLTFELYSTYWSFFLKVNCEKSYLNWVTIFRKNWFFEILVNSIWFTNWLRWILSKRESSTTKSLDFETLFIELDALKKSNILKFRR